MQTQLLTGSSETVRLSTKNKLKHLQLTGRKDYLQIFKIMLNPFMTDSDVM